MNNDGADDHIALPGFNNPAINWTFGDPYFSVQKQNLATIVSTLSKKNEQKLRKGF